MGSKQIAFNKALDKALDVPPNTPDGWMSVRAGFYDELLGDNKELREALRWALQHVEFPLVSESPDEESGLWKGCPGCRVVWMREMRHKEGCEYMAALALRDAA